MHIHMRACARKHLCLYASLRVPLRIALAQQWPKPQTFSGSPISKQSSTPPIPSLSVALRAPSMVDASGQWNPSPSPHPALEHFQRPKPSVINIKGQISTHARTHAQGTDTHSCTHDCTHTLSHLHSEEFLPFNASPEA